MYLGLDLGTSGVKALLIDGRQAVIGSGHASLDVSRPHHGWSEQDPAEWVRACRQAIAELKAAHSREFAAIKGIGLSGQMHGATLLDAGAALPKRPSWTPIRVSASSPATSFSRALPRRNWPG